MTNGGEITFTHTAVLNSLPLSVHFDERSLATILSMKDIARIPGARITMDSAKERAVFVKLADRTVLKFEECSSRLYYFDSNNFNKKSVISVIGYSALETVAANELQYMESEL